MRTLASRQGLLDHPNWRSSHTVPTPRLGGVGIWAPTIVVSLVAFNLHAGLGSESDFLWPILAGGLAIAGVGLVDDLKASGIRPRTKYVGQVVSALVVVIGAEAFLGTGQGTQAASWALIGSVSILQVLWLTAMSNFVNFIDGADGLVGGISVVALLCAALILRHAGDPLSTVALIAALSTLGFLFFNLPRAGIFMGDSGSLFLGFVIAALGLALPLAFSGDAGALAGTHIAKGIVVALGITAPVWVDAVTTLGVRVAARRPVASPHRDHLYQRMLGAGVSTWAVNLAYWAYAALCGAAAFAVSSDSALGYPALTILVVAGVSAVLGLHRTGTARPWTQTPGRTWLR